MNLMACSCDRRHGTRQFCLVSDCVHIADKTVLSRLDPTSMGPRWRCEHNWRHDKNPVLSSWRCEHIRSQDKTVWSVWSPVVFTPPTRQDKSTVLSRPRRWCEQAIRILNVVTKFFVFDSM